ncbi:hypothetical protein KUM42_16070 [Modestobacter sp. L9-4]|uniref:hypothetical protein n=1 Tax=Modestobacter sp. L9-4 TaxID=2851567 RepID=UPI001C7675C1|nr:hypothetical protein [Modestobacter sp. L9-4]QXG75330.1 hypothetical protein KUM42_16070 [Modestobacter sp. L9-4]
MTAATTTRSRNVRKVLGSLAIVGAAAGVAGMGTFGTFTDSTAPLAASVSSGVLSLDLTAVGGSATLPTMSVTNFVPGDSVSRPVELVNSGDTGLGFVSMVSTASTSSILDTDKVNGLQLNVQGCSSAWTAATNAGVTTYSCTPGAVSFFAGPAVTAGTNLTGLQSLNARSTDHLLITVALPTTADNAFQNKSSALSISFTGTQKTGTNR